MPSHQTGNWHKAPDYLLTYEFIPPGRYPNQATLNSCDNQLSSSLQCSGRGVCKAWYPDDETSTMNFCECFRDWADPECRTERSLRAMRTALHCSLASLVLINCIWGFQRTQQ